MSSDQPPRSLMDDAEFLRELEKLEPSGKGRQAEVQHRTIETLDDGLAPAKPQPLRDLEDQLDRGDLPPVLPPNPFRLPPVRQRTGIRNPIVLAVFLLVMAAVGAGAAVLVFYDRLAWLLR